MCIDVFGEQDKNLDASARVTWMSFARTWAGSASTPPASMSLRRSSEDVQQDDVLQRVGPARFFSIDGGHWKAIVRNDLRLAENTLADDGVIALDDYCRAQWPEVTAGHSLWQEETESDIRPFAVS